MWQFFLIVFYAMVQFVLKTISKYVFILLTLYLCCILIINNKWNFCFTFKINKFHTMFVLGYLEHLHSFTEWDAPGSQYGGVGAGTSGPGRSPPPAMPVTMARPK
jgi:hypothetical protein